jgi:hypothetical protein
MSQPKEKICPLMSARVTSLSNPNEANPKITPTIVKCVPECALWDKAQNQCVIRSINTELIGISEVLNVK